MLFLLHERFILFAVIFGFCSNLNAAITQTITPGNWPPHGTRYNTLFGHLDSNYSMGDLARYTVTPGDKIPTFPIHAQNIGKSVGLNIYYDMSI